MDNLQTSLLAALLAAHADYVVVGGVAVNRHGYMRATNDLDLFIRPTLENAAAVYHSLRQLGIPLEGIEAVDLLDDEENLRFGPPENHVDILASIGEISFDRVWSNRVEQDVDGLLVPFISKADLIANKLQVGRLRDLADVEELRLIPDLE